MFTDGVGERAGGVESLRPGHRLLRVGLGAPEIRLGTRHLRFRLLDLGRRLVQSGPAKGVVDPGQDGPVLDRRAEVDRPGSVPRVAGRGQTPE